MTINIITCHSVYNFGASLQAYALSHYLKSEGHDVKIINYRPWYQRGIYSLTAVNNPKYNKPGLRQLYLLAKFFRRLKGLRTKKRFDKFTKNYMSLTREYTSYEELCQNPPEADISIAGSDQIWNPYFQNGHDKAFYLGFVKSNTRKISYAPSFAVDNIQPKLHEFARMQIKSLDAVSVREKSALRILASLGIESAIQVCDPIFLIARAQWEHMASLSKLDLDNYILVYECSDNHNVKDTAKKIRETTGYKIAYIGSWKDADINLLYSDPIDFLYEIKNSKFVVTDSYHATLFSIVFEKNFFVANRDEPLNARIYDILSLTNLDNRLISTATPISLLDINWENHISELNALITTSKEYLSQQIKLCKDTYPNL